MNIGTLTIEMAANVGRLTQDMNQAKSLVDSSMKTMAASVGIAKQAFVALTGVASAAAFKSMVDGVIQAKIELQRLSYQTGASVEALSAIAAVAKVTGTNIDTVGGAINKMQLSLAKNNEDGKGAAQAIQALGLNFEQFKNLKADDQMLQVAKAMAGFQDGAGKAATAMLLWGKSGAQLLPLMKDLAEKNELIGKTTSESAKQAEEYEKAMKKLEAQGQTWRRELVDFLLPAMVSMTNQLIEGKKAFGGYWDAMVGIGLKTNPFASAAENAKKAASDVIGLRAEIAKLDQGRTSLTTNAGGAAFVGPSGSSTSSSRLSAARQELELAIKQKAYYDAIAADAGNNYRQEGRNHPKPELKVAVKDPLAPKDDPARRILEGQLKAYQDFIDANKTQLETREKYLEYYQGLEYFNLRDVEEKKRSLMGDNLALTLQYYDKEVAAIQKYIDQAGRETDKQEGRNKVTEELKKRAAAEVAANGQIVESHQKLLAVQRQFDLANGERSRQDAIANDDAQFQIDMLGRNTLEVLKLTNARRIELELAQRIYQLHKLDPQADTSEAITRAAIQTAQSGALIEASYNKQRDAIFGANEATRKYLEDITDQGAQMQKLWSNSFKGMEDALVSFVTAGKLNFKGLANSIISELVRIQVQQSIMKPFTAGIQNGGGILGGLSSLLGPLFGTGYTGYGGPTGSSATLGFGGRYAAGGSPPVGVPSLVGERGPELFIPATAGTIVPNGKMGSTINLTNHITIDARSDRADVYALVVQANHQSQEQLVGTLRQAGVLG